MSISELRSQIRDELLEFAWSQWAQLGMSAHATRSDRWCVDPEALILFTVEVARRDPRLFDELLDWMSLNGRLLSLQRLRNLTPRFAIDRDLVEAVVTWVGESSPSLRWRATAETQTESGAAPVFDQTLISFIGDPDPAFERYGYVRPRAERSEKSRGPDLSAPINMAFQLRLLFGPGSRSEVLRVLLTAADRPLDAARIADDAGFAKRNVSDALTSLVESRVVKARWSKNERVFIAYRNKWATLLEIGPSASHLPTFVSWVYLLPALLEVLLWFEDESLEGLSEYMLSSGARDLIERITPALEATGIPVPLGASMREPDSTTEFEGFIRSLLTFFRPRKGAGMKASQLDAP